MAERRVSGLNDWELRFFKDQFSQAEKISKPFDIGEPYTALRTNLKVKVKFYEVTEANVMRHPVFIEVATT